jgi:hypothetical protein
LAAEMLAPTAVEEVAGAAVGETMATVTPETMAEFSSAASGNTTAAPRAAIVNATPAVLTPLPIAIGNTTSGCSSPDECLKPLSQPQEILSYNKYYTRLNRLLKNAQIGITFWLLKLEKTQNYF